MRPDRARLPFALTVQSSGRATGSRSRSCTGAKPRNNPLFEPPPTNPLLQTTVQTVDTGWRGRAETRTYSAAGRFAVPLATIAMA